VVFTAAQLRTVLRQGAISVVLAQIVSQLAMLALLAVMYRLLGPRPYGLLGMAMTLLLLLRILIPGGLDVAIIRHEEVGPQQWSGLFWLSQALALVAVAVTLLLAPLMAWFYATDHGPVWELPPLVAALAGTAAAQALGTPHQALLQRHLRLGRLAAIRVAAQISGGLAAVAAALAGWGVWALVLQQYCELLVLAALAWWSEPWRPAWAFGGAQTRGLIRFGGYYTLSGLMFYVVANADKVLVGRVLGDVALGLYGQAFNLAMKPVNLVITPLTGVMLPALSRAADRGQYRALVLGFNRAIALVMMPAGAGLMIVAHEVVRVLGGNEWAPAGPLLAVLGLAVMVQGFFNALGSVFASDGRPRRLFLASAIIAAVMVAGFFIGLHAGTWLGWPVLGMALGYALTLSLVVFPPYLVAGFRMVGLSGRQWLKQVTPAAGATAGMAAAVLACRWGLQRCVAPSAGPLLLAEMVVGIAVYGWLARRELARVLQAGRGA